MEIEKTGVGLGEVDVRGGRELVKNSHPASKKEPPKLILLVSLFFSAGHERDRSINPSGLDIGRMKKNARVKRLAKLNERETSRGCKGTFLTIGN